MSLLRKSRNNQDGAWRWIQFIVLSALVALFVARFASTVFTNSASRTTITSSAHDSHRACFDHDGSEWVYSASGFSLRPPEIVLLHASLNPEAQKAFEANGFHYNRPPPFL